MRINLKAKDGPQKIILQYLEENASDVLVEKINSGNKTMDDCWQFIYKQARENSKGNSACFEDQIVFGWAIHFFEEDSIVVKTEKKEEEVEKVPEKVEQKKAVVKKNDDLQQITLFDLVGE